MSSRAPKAHPTRSSSTSTRPTRSSSAKDKKPQKQQKLQQAELTPTKEMALAPRPFVLSSNAATTAVTPPPAPPPPPIHPRGEKKTRTLPWGRVLFFGALLIMLILIAVHYIDVFGDDDHTVVESITACHCSWDLAARRPPGPQGPPRLLVPWRDQARKDRQTAASASVSAYVSHVSRSWDDLSAYIATEYPTLPPNAAFINVTKIMKSALKHETGEGKHEARLEGNVTRLREIIVAKLMSLKGYPLPCYIWFVDYNSLLETKLFYALKEFAEVGTLGGVPAVLLAPDSAVLSRPHCSYLSRVHLILRSDPGISLDTIKGAQVGAAENRASLVVRQGDLY